MKQKLIDKDVLVAEIERIKEKDYYDIHDEYDGFVRNALDKVLSFIDTLEVKEAEEYKQPEYSCLGTMYQCGKKPRWNVGDTLAYYEFYSDREGECVLGKVSKTELDEELCDWFYTFEDESIYSEQSLLEDETYRKN